MIAKTARYQVRPETLDECLRLVREFTAAVNENEEGTVLYAALQEKDDPTRFINVMAFVDGDAEASHRETPWVKTFVEGLYPNTVDGVTFTDHDVVAGL